MMNILLIEDNLSIIKGIKYNLEQNNYQVVAKKNISDSINYLNSNNKIDLIILDVTLPDGNGFNLYENNIKDLNIPTIILTAVDDEDNVVKGLELGVNEYITKPFSMKELLTRINRIMVRKNNNSTIKIKDIWQKPISIFAKNITLSEGQTIRMYVSVTKTAHGILYAFI